MYRNLWILSLIFALSLGRVWAHGVEGEVRILSGAVVVTAWYDTGEPMSYARVEIYAPDSRFRFQSGRTDRNGRVAFVPDVPGTWRVIISDRLGHRLELRVKVTAPGESIGEVHGGGPPLPRPLAAVVGVVLVLGIFGWVRGFKRARRRAGDEDGAAGPGVRLPGGPPR